MLYSCPCFNLKGVKIALQNYCCAIYCLQKEPQLSLQVIVAKKGNLRNTWLFTKIKTT